MKQVLVLVGPTAVGKSDYAVEIAQKMNGEIISGDSIQVYQGMDIGSGKITEEEKKGIPHALLDILSVKQGYSVADFQNHAREEIKRITALNKLPIIVGGTGLYIKACLYDYSFDEQTQEKIDPDFLQKSNEELYAQLKIVDPQSCEIIHPNNRKRILRALIIAQSGKTKSEREQEQNHELMYDALIIGLTCSREMLAERISQRVDRMMAAGLKQEVQGLLEQGATFQDQAMLGIGYREWQSYFEKQATIQEVSTAIKTHSRQFAKRQFTWFKHQIPVAWLNIEEKNWKEEGLLQIQKWRNGHE